MIQRRAVRLATNAVQRAVFARMIIEYIKIVLLLGVFFLAPCGGGGGLQPQHRRLHVGRAVTYVEIQQHERESAHELIDAAQSQYQK